MFVSVPSTGDSGEHDREGSCFHGFYILVGDTDNKQVNRQTW